MKKLVFALVFVVFSLSTVYAQQKSLPVVHRTCNEVANRRTEIILPQVKGFNIYKGDFHTHTIYSDGAASTTGRVDEAWYDGLDILAITDHYESNSGVKRFFKVAAPYNSDGKPTKYVAPGSTKMPKDGVDPGIKIDFNAIHKEAEWAVGRRGYDLLLVKGCEMARNNEKLGHFNALFVEDLNSIYNFDIKEAFKNVKKQGGIIIHNHPGNIEANNPEWHEAVRKEGLIDGYEVANGFAYYPRIHKRCVDEKLIMLGNTDVHGMNSHKYGTTGWFRTMTFVLAKELTQEAIKEALLERRTIVYSGGDLIGEEEWLNELLNESIQCQLVKENKKSGTRIYTLTNLTSLTYKLRRGQTIYTLEPFRTITASWSKDKKSGKLLYPRFRVENMWVTDYKHPYIDIKVDKK